MAALKWIVVVLFGLGSAGSLAMAFVTGGAPYVKTPRSAPQLALRPFPEMVAAAGAVKTVPVAEKPPEAEPVKVPEPVAAKPEAVAEPVAAKPEPIAAAKPPPAVVPKAEPVAPKPEPVAAKPEPKPEPVAAKPEPKPEPVAVAAKPEPKPEPMAAPPPAKLEGILNLRASDTADVFLDGKKLGGSPLIGIKAKVGNHKVRFDCYDAAGNTVAGPAQTIAVKADAEVDVEYPCPVE